MSLMIFAATSHAQESPQPPAAESQPLPAWVVLVLEPTGQNRVRPVSGVVVAQSGLVIVPAEFASSGDQIMVLDGGTDLNTHGRAARILRSFPEVGLTVLSVDGLRRIPPTLSASAFSDGDEIRLSSFPPAELIAQGEAPVDISVALSVSGNESAAGQPGLPRYSIPAEKALPNVTGPLLDSCGNLVGLSMAEGVQSMDTHQNPSYLWVDSLRSVLLQLSLSLKEKPCPEPEITQAQQADPVLIEPEDEVAEIGVAQGGDSLDSGDAGQTANVFAPPPYLWLALGVFVVLAVVGWLFFGRRGANSGNAAELDGDGDTIAMRSSESSQKLNRKPHHQLPRNDSIFEIKGHLASGKSFVASCQVSAAAIDVVIGKNTADINIDSQEVHPEHARFGGNSESLTISDLGSSRGTWINAVPCLKGEIMFLEKEDTIYLGNVSFTVSVRPLQNDSATS